SCRGGNCGRGSGCKCGSGCGEGNETTVVIVCKMYPELTEREATIQTMIGRVVVPRKGWLQGSQNGGCKCGSNCTYDPCTC
ncbi:unnamed protein product, partial [Musa hybrid cultivar]